MTATTVLTAVWVAPPVTTRTIDYRDPHTGRLRQNRIRHSRSAHLVRDDRALCGRPLTDGSQPVDNPFDPGIDRCWQCASLGPDAVTYRDILDATGITYRQLDHWCRKGWLRPDNPDSGSGTARVFPASELAVVVEMARLVNAGVRPEVAATLARGPGDLELAWAAGRGESA